MILEHTIIGRNVNHNYASSVERIRHIGVAEDSRNGPVLVAPHPVMTATERPTERVLFCPNRDANPFFHFFECLWMMSGSKDGKWLDRFVGDFSSRYGEEDGTIHGAYGARWRKWPQLYERDGLLWQLTGADQFFDQLLTTVNLLMENKRDRRVVVSMWDPNQDLAEDVGDVPCNTHMYPRVRSTDSGAVLDLTVCCRSNDIIWGATGANAVHFSFLQEWMAAQIGVGVGRMYQLSNNWHAYENTLEKVGEPQLFDHYSSVKVAPYPICRVPEAWDEDLRLFMDNPNKYVYSNSFFGEVAVPMWNTHCAWRGGHRSEAMDIVSWVAATDWQEAARAWMQRRIDRAVK